MPAKTKPMSARDTIQAAGAVDSAIRSTATAPVATKAAKARMCPTCRTMAGVFSVPASIPAK